MLQANLRFIPEREGASADGWEVAIGDESSSPTVTYYATITLALTAITDAFRTDPTLLGYFSQAAEATVLAANDAGVAAALAAALAAEGL